MALGNKRLLNTGLVNFCGASVIRNGDLTWNDQHFWVSSMRGHMCTKIRCLRVRFGVEQLSTEPEKRRN